MSKIRLPIIIIGSILLCVISSLITYLALAGVGAIETNDPIELEFTLKNEEKVYDGIPLNASSYTLDKGSLKEGHTANVTYTDGLTNVGSKIVDLFIKIIDENGFDVTTEYNIKTNSATLTITPRPLEYKILDAEMVYNGEELSYDSFEVTNGGLLSGHKLIPQINSTASNVGEKPQAKDVTTNIFDTAGNNVTSNYMIKYTIGDLIITKRNLVLAPIPKTKEYDGTALKCDSYKIEYGSLVSGHTVEATYSEGIVNAGSVEGFITSAKVYDEVGNDVTSNYNISFNDGALLKVTPRKLIINMANKSKVYDRTSLSCNKFEISKDTPLLNDDKFEAISFSIDQNELIEVGKVENTITDYRIRMDEGLGNDVTSNYNVIINKGTLEIKKAPLSLTALSHSWIYDGKSHTLENTENQLFNDDLLYIEGLVDRNLDIIEFNYQGAITNAGVRNNNIVLKNITINVDGKKIDVTDNYEITLIPGELKVEKAKLTITGKSEEKEYDGLPLTYENVFECESVIGLKNEIEEVILTYSKNEITNVGEIKNVIEEVAIQNGLISNYDIELVHGYLRILPRNLVLTAKSENYIYNGNTHTLKAPSILTKEDLLNYDGLLENDNLQFNYSGEITNVGSIANKIESVNILSTSIIDGSLVYNDVTSNYNIICENGTLTVEPIDITLKAESLTKNTYDGIPLKIDGEQQLANDNILSNHTLFVTYSGEIVNVGSTFNKIDKYRIIDNLGIDVTNNYNVTEIINGYLTITNKMSITLDCKDISLEYNGYEQGYYDYIKKTYDYLSVEHLNSDVTLGMGDTLRFKYSGKAKNVGALGENTINLNDIVIEAIDGSRITNYEINILSGNIQITKKTLSIVGISDSKKYDGTKLTYAGDNKSNEDLKSYSGLIEGHRITFTYSGEIINVGNANNEISNVMVFNDSGADVSNNYNFETTITPGILIIEKQNIIISHHNIKKEFDNKDLVLDDNNINISCSLDGITFEATEYTNAIDINIHNISILNGNIYLYNELQNNDNFNIIYKDFTVEIVKRKVVIEAIKYETVYDSAINTIDNVALLKVSNETSLIEGDALFDVTFETDPLLQATSMPQELIIDRIVIKNGSTTVTDNYDFEFINGSFWVKPYEITVNLNSFYKIYDGTPLDINEGNIILNSSNIPVGFNLSIESINLPDDLINVQNSIYSASLYIEYPGETNYNIIVNPGSINIEKRSLSIVGLSKTFTYDGLAHSFSDSTNAESVVGLALTDTLSVSYSGEITNVGKVSNVITDVQITGGIENYNITIINGTIEVLKRDVVIVISDVELAYNGMEQTSNLYTTADTVFNNDTNVLVVTTGKITNIGQVTNNGYVIGANASNYNVTIVPGTITVS